MDKIIDKVLENIDLKVINNNFNKIINFFPSSIKECFIDQLVTEIMIVDNSVYIERNCKIEKLDSIISKNTLDVFLDYISMYNGRNIDFNHPIFDGRIDGGMRCSVICEPLCLNKISINIRKHNKNIDSFKTLVESNMLSSSVAKDLINFVKEKKNIIISGGTGSGKTTFLNVLLNEGLSDERVVTIEDTAELNLNLKHVIKLQAFYKTPDCNLEFTIRDLVKSSLRMRPDRLIIGEVRGEEAYDFLHAMNTGHSGTICTIHANSCRDALRRLETLSILSHSNLNISIPRSWIAANINVIIYLEKEKGVRRVKEVKVLEGLEGSSYVLCDFLN